MHKLSHYIYKFSQDIYKLSHDIFKFPSNIYKNYVTTYIQIISRYTQNFSRYTQIISRHVPIISRHIHKLSHEIYQLSPTYTNPYSSPAPDMLSARQRPDRSVHNCYPREQTWRQSVLSPNDVSAAEWARVGAIVVVLVLTAWRPMYLRPPARMEISVFVYLSDKQ